MVKVGKAMFSFLFRLDLHGRYFEQFETPERYIDEFAPRPLSPCVDLSARFRRFTQRLQEQKAKNFLLFWDAKM
tara:strand:- start:2253 stop:2474 length:222 start_codon:yes stop_codon:yes gene_type:complete